MKAPSPLSLLFYLSLSRSLSPADTDPPLHARTPRDAVGKTHDELLWLGGGLGYVSSDDG